MGSRGARSGVTSRGSPDGVFKSGGTTRVETIYREGRGYSSGYFKNEVLEAITDGKGNITFNYAKGGEFTKNAKTNRTNYVTYDLKAGAVDGKTFNINWSKVNSVSGKTYSVKAEAKEAGLKWDGKGKRWSRS